MSQFAMVERCLMYANNAIARLLNLFESSDLEARY